MIGTREDDDRVAIVARSQTREPMSLTFAELREQVARARWGLLQPRRRSRATASSATCPTSPETVVAFIATASLGATWATCAPEFGSRSVIDRFAQIEPKVLLTVGGYGFRDRYLDRTEEVAKLREALPTSSTSCTSPTARRRSPTPSSGPSCSALRGAARVRAGAVRPPARRAVLLRDDRPAQGDRPRARQPARRALQGPRPAVGRRAREAPAAVHDDRVDDVERARVGAHPARPRSSSSTATPRGPTSGCSGASPPRPARRTSACPPPSSWPAARPGCSRGATSTSRGSRRSSRPARRCRPRGSSSSTSSSGPRRCSSTAAAAPTCARRS